MRLRDSLLTSEGRLKGWFWLVSLLLAGAGARLWLVHTFGTTLPFWDQWEEARFVYIPYLNGKLTWSLLLSPHNEHRILFTRLWSLGLLLANGEYDNLVQMVANVLLYSATLAGFGWVLARLMGRRYWPIVALPLLLALALPFAWENSLAGFHSQFYFMVLFSLLALWLLGFYRPGTMPWLLGLLAAIASLFTVASGLIASAALCGLVGLRILRQPATWKAHWPTLVAGVVVVALGFALKVDVPHHRILMAHSLPALFISLGKYLAWPWIVLPPFAPFNVFPLLLLAWVYFRDRQTPMPGEEMVLALGGWTVLQAAASAYARGSQAFPQWRYMDSLCFLMIANALSLALLATRHLDRIPFRRYFKPAACLWVLACVSGLLLLDWRAWTLDIPLRHMYHQLQQVTARAYFATGDRRYLHTHEKEYLARFAGPDAPDPDHAKAFIAVLDAPHVHSMLPTPVRAPLPMAPASVSGFVTNSTALVKPAVPGEVSWSSFAAEGAKAKGRFESQPVPKSRFPFLEFLVGGELGGPGLSLTIVDLTSGQITSIRPHHLPGDKWVSCRVKAPPGEFKVVATDQSDTAWFAFQAPREVGRLSWAAECLAAFGPVLFFVGTGLYLVGIGWTLRHQT